jgi:hypothetical protein
MKKLLMILKPLKILMESPIELKVEIVIQREKVKEILVNQNIKIIIILIQIAKKIVIVIIVKKMVNKIF